MTAARARDNASTARWRRPAAAMGSEWSVDMHWVVIGGLVVSVCVLYTFVTRFGYERKASGKWSDDDY
jgi:hypothetical protein